MVSGLTFQRLNLTVSQFNCVFVRTQFSRRPDGPEQALHPSQHRRRTHHTENGPGCCAGQLEEIWSQHVRFGDAEDRTDSPFNSTVLRRQILRKGRDAVVASSSSEMLPDSCKLPRRPRKRMPPSVPFWQLPTQIPLSISVRPNPHRFAIYLHDHLLQPLRRECAQAAFCKTFIMCVPPRFSSMLEMH